MSAPEPPYTSIALCLNGLLEEKKQTQEMRTKNCISAGSWCGMLTSGRERCKAGMGRHRGLREITPRAHQEQIRVCGSICRGKTAVVKPVTHLHDSHLPGETLDTKENK